MEKEMKVIGEIPPPPAPNNTLADCKCLLCGEVGLAFVNKLRDDDTHYATRCNHCGHVQLAPLPTVEEDEEFYKKDKMLKNIFKDIQSLQTEEKLMYRMELFVHEQADNLEKYLPPKSEQADMRLIDIGTGFGWLPQFMREKGYQMDGVEINDEKRELCKQRCGIEIFGWNFLKDEPEVMEKAGYYDVLCMTHVLEHISDPVLFLKRASILLKPKGMLFIDVPNFNDYYREYQKEYSDWAFMRAHVNYFTPETLTKVMERGGFSEMKVYGHQPHSIENAIHWWRNKAPDLRWHQFYLPEPLEWINKIYKAKIESEVKSTFISAVGYKK
ncbi:MAG: class I SAM-dependent methyltransferase [Treponema sp.]|jgi:2-polyprenyl-3-methyl-5-hydroxy-6-metoxy-1,4-benzoquinol methylase|nr:class I SAM-dependent methyltransferase [Treponema sp.]